MLIFKDVSFSYENESGKTVPVLDQFNLSIKQGIITSIIGPSGCGKTTLANLISGYLNPISGQINLNGAVVKKPGIERIVMNQEMDIFPWMTVCQNLKIVNADLNKINSVLELTNLTAFKSNFPKELSGGMKKRLSFARALLVDPELIILDEPFSSLDIKVREQLYEEVVRISSEFSKTILLITHDIREAVQLSDEIFVLSNLPVSIQGKFSLLEKDLPPSLRIDYYNQTINKIETLLRSEQ